MKKIKKISLIIGIVLVAVILAAAIVIATCLDKIVKTGIVTVAPTITQTTVTLDSVGISLLTGSASVKGLVVGNPSGYLSASAISIGKAAVSISPGSLLSDKIVIHSIEINAPEITFEGNPFGENNLNKILANVNSAAGAAAPATASPSAGKKPAKKLEVDDFLLAGAKVHVQLTGLLNKQLNLTLPDIHLTDLGKGTGGITAVDLTQKVLQEVIADTVKAVGSAAGKITGQGVNKIRQGLGGLFGK